MDGLTGAWHPEPPGALGPFRRRPTCQILCQEEGLCLHLCGVRIRLRSPRGTGRRQSWPLLALRHRLGRSLRGTEVVPRRGRTGPADETLPLPRCRHRLGPTDGYKGENDAVRFIALVGGVALGRGLDLCLGVHQIPSSPSFTRSLSLTATTTGYPSSHILLLLH